MSNGYCWVDYGDDEEDYFFDESALLDEFEKMLNGQDNKYKEISGKAKKESQDNCFSHIWEIVGRGPVSDTPWINCKKCGIAKEEDEKR